MISKFAQILGKIAGGVAGMAGGVLGAVGGYAASSLLGYVGNKFSPPKQLINFNSPEFGRAMEMNVNQNLAQQASDNPLAVSPSTNQRISDDTKAAMYMQGRQLNAQYDPELQRSQMLGNQLQMGQMGAFGGTQNVIGGFGDLASELANQWQRRGKAKQKGGTGLFARGLQQIGSTLGSIQNNGQNQTRQLR